MKKQNFSKRLCILLSVAMLFCSFSTVISAESDEKISEVHLEINKPLSGWKLHDPDVFDFNYYFFKTPDEESWMYTYYDEYDSYLTGDIIHNGIRWFEDRGAGFKRDVKKTDTFAAGKTYGVTVTVQACDGYMFTNGTEAYINGNKADSVKIVQGINTCTITYVFPECRTTGDTIYIKDFDEPRAGARPDITASAGGVGFYVNGDILWRNETDDKTMDSTEMFEAEKEYTATFFIRADDAQGYTFPRDEYDCPLNMQAKINGMPVEICDIETKNGLSIMIEKTYVIDKVIDSVDISYIDIPQAGQKPDMVGDINSDGCEYSITEGTDTIYWVEYDGLVDHRMGADDTFKEGKTYGMRFCLFAESGYAFRLNDDDEVDVHATVNGKDAQVVSSAGNTYCEFEWRYTVPISFDHVDITNIAVPEAGGNAIREATVSQSQYCDVTEVIWVEMNEEDAHIYDIHTFSPGKQYCVQIALQARDGYVFYTADGYQEITATVNGKEALVYGSHSDTEAVIGYTFDALPQQNTQLLLKSGSSFVVNHTQKTVVIGKKTTSATVKENIENENFKLLNNKGEDASAEEFIGTNSRIQLTNAGGTVLDEYTVIVRYDADGDGNVQAADARLALRHSVKLELLTGVYLVAADIDGGGVSASDARSILRNSVGLSD